MLATLRQDVCKLCGARWLRRAADVARSVRIDRSKAAVTASFSTSTSKYRREADIDRPRSIKPRISPNRGGRQPKKEKQSIFSLSSEQPDASLEKVDYDYVVKQLNNRLQELAGFAVADAEGSGQSISGFVSALAKALGLDVEELSDFAQRWAETRPLSLLGNDKGKQRESLIRK